MAKRSRGYQSNGGCAGMCPGVFELELLVRGVGKTLRLSSPSPCSSEGSGPSLAIIYLSGS